MPILFRASWCKPHFATWDNFITSPIWPYVRYVDVVGYIYMHICVLMSFSRLSIYGFWEDIDFARFGPERIPIPLADALSRLPNVSEVAFQDTARYGVPRATLTSVLSFPGLRSLDTEDNFHSVWEKSPPHITFAVAPLVCLRQVLPKYRRQPHRSAEDMEFLRYLMDQLQLRQSLETLIIPSENAPLEDIATHEWPRLKVLSLRGESQRIAIPLISVFERMPTLGELTLETACASKMGRNLFCPLGWTGPCPWPELTSLIVSYPHPSDPLYAHLPYTLRSLTLRCWPRHYVTLLPHEAHYVVDKMGWDSPILSSSELLQILSRCPPSNLEELELEFEEDGHDLELFALIPLIFPNLVKLTVLRYRKWGNPEVPVVSLHHPILHPCRANVETSQREIGKALAPLRNLVVMYLHLDFKIAPHPYALGNDTAVEEFGKLAATLQNAVDVLAHELSHSVDTVYFLQRRMSKNFWVPYHITRTKDAVHANELDSRYDV